MNANIFAYIALAAWPMVAVVLFARLPLQKAIIWTLLGGYLLLPPGIEVKIPMIPAFDKESIPNLCVLAGCIVVMGRLPRVFPKFGIAEVLLLVLLVGPFVTSELNGDPIFVGPRVIPGVGLYDAGSAVLSALIALIPFIIGRNYLRSGEDSFEILRALVIAGLLYSILMLIEVRLSPQLNRWIYGYFPSSFLQAMRDGGFRPVVFLRHGLLVAFFAATAVLASGSMWRMGAKSSRMARGGITLYLLGVLAACKTMSAFFYGAAFLPIAKWASPKTQLRIAAAIAACAISYPIVRAADLVPTQELLSLAASFSEDRAQSLQVRFDNEDVLLAHAQQRFWFGWGRYGRNRVYSQEDGRDLTITDGEWIIQMGRFGFVGFLAEFGLLGWGILRLARSGVRPSASWLEYGAPVALILSVNMIDLIPNSSMTPWTWLLAGSLLGQAELALASYQRAGPPNRYAGVRLTSGTGKVRAIDASG